MKITNVMASLAFTLAGISVLQAQERPMTEYAANEEYVQSEYPSTQYEQSPMYPAKPRHSKWESYPSGYQQDTIRSQVYPYEKPQITPEEEEEYSYIQKYKNPQTFNELQTI